MNYKVLILLGSASDLPNTVRGTGILESFGIPFSLRVASAHRTPAKVERLVKEFEETGGQMIICGAGMSAHLAGVVAALSTLPVLAVPIERSATAGFDSLLSMSQMPGGIPVATMGFGKSGFENAALIAAQVMALNDPALKQKLKDHRVTMAEKVDASDKESRIDFNG